MAPAASFRRAASAGPRSVSEVAVSVALADDIGLPPELGGHCLRTQSVDRAPTATEVHREVRPCHGGGVAADRRRYGRHRVSARMGSIAANRRRGYRALAFRLASDARGVAQPGSAPALGAGGPGFKSRRPDYRRSWKSLVSGDSSKYLAAAGIKQGRSKSFGGDSVNAGQDWLNTCHEGCPEPPAGGSASTSCGDSCSPPDRVARAHSAMPA